MLNEYTVYGKKLNILYMVNFVVGWCEINADYEWNNTRYHQTGAAVRLDYDYDNIINYVFVYFIFEFHFIFKHHSNIYIKNNFLLKKMLMVLIN